MMDIKDLEDWYQVTRKQVIQQGGASLLQAYGGSIRKGKLYK
jgi:hypothetical protein